MAGATKVYRFGPFEVDCAQYRLSEAGEPVHTEPLVFDLLVLFVTNAGTVIDRERMCEEVWKGRIVSDSTLSTAVKAMRRALGDSGGDQKYLETVRGRGFRFVAKVTEVPDTDATPADAPLPVREAPPVSLLSVPPASPAGIAVAERPAGAVPKLGSKPSIAVLPFARLGAADSWEGLELAIPHEIIVSLSRVRWLTVIARASAFRMAGEVADPAAICTALGVRYCLTGTVELFGRALAVGVELARTDPVEVVWGDWFTGNLDDVHALRAQMVRGIAAAIEDQIPASEADLAARKAPENLDAWQLFHLGLSEMNRFNQAGNARAQGCFEQAIAKEPGLARAHAGLSFTHFQNAFLNYRGDREGEVMRARRAAEMAMELDARDPFSNFSLGRVHWLAGDLEGGISWLETATTINPNYAQGHYSMGIMEMMAGRSFSAQDRLDRAMGLSPLDPMLYAMRAATGFALVSEGDLQGAADWADLAARTHQSHAIVWMGAAACCHLAERPADARHWAEHTRSLRPDADRGFFFAALPIRDTAIREPVERALIELGF